jgi:hypothetical protein
MELSFILQEPKPLTLLHSLRGPFLTYCTSRVMAALRCISPLVAVTVKK